MKSDHKTIARTYLSLTILAVVSAALVFAFQYLSELIAEFLLIEFEATVLNITIYFFAIIFLGLFEYWFLRGPFFKGEVYSIRVLVKKDIHIHWIKAVIKMFFACLITFLIGLPLGSEGPSVFLCALLAEGIFWITKSKKEDLQGITIGGALGFSLAVLNPLAGISYFYEPMRKKPKLSVMLEDVYAALLGYTVIVLLRWAAGYDTPYLSDEFQTGLTFFSSDHVGLIFMIPFIAFAAASLFKAACKHRGLQQYCSQKEWAVWSTLFAAVMVVALKFTGNSAMLGSGSYIMTMGLLSLEDVIMFLFIRFFFMSITFDLFFAGGQVIPSMSLGYLLGNLVLCLLPDCGMTEAEKQLFCILMALCYYSFVVERYWTAVFLGMSFGPVWIVSLYMLVLLPLTWGLGKYVGSKESLATIAHMKHYPRQGHLSKRRHGVRA